MVMLLSSQLLERQRFILEEKNNDFVERKHLNQLWEQTYKTKQLNNKMYTENDLSWLRAHTVLVTVRIEQGTITPCISPESDESQTLLMDFGIEDIVNEQVECVGRVQCNDDTVPLYRLKANIEKRQRYIYNNSIIMLVYEDL